MIASEKQCNLTSHRAKYNDHLKRTNTAKTVAGYSTAATGSVLQENTSTSQPTAPVKEASPPPEPSVSDKASAVVPPTSITRPLGDPSRSADELWQDSVQWYPPTRGPLYDHRKVKEKFNHEREAARSRPISIVLWNAPHCPHFAPMSALVDLSSGVFLLDACSILDKEIAYLATIQFYDFHHIVGPSWIALGTNGHITLEPSDNHILLCFPPPATKSLPLDTDYVGFMRYVEMISNARSLKR
ncbi:unnamed protein product [Peniophora sp. CBMAI 1063]|nr:unnamed protein product [Peniophora sp. CBMAI 1063]